MKNVADIFFAKPHCPALTVDLCNSTMTAISNAKKQNNTIER